MRERASLSFVALTWASLVFSAARKAAFADRMVSRISAAGDDSALQSINTATTRIEDVWIWKYMAPPHECPSGWDYEEGEQAPTECTERHCGTQLYSGSHDPRDHGSASHKEWRWG